MKAHLLVGSLVGWLVVVGPAAALNCPTDTKTVCAASADGHRSNFNGACFAQQKGFRVLHSGRCEAPDEPSACSHLMNPVCATDPATGKQRTYPNTCTAEVATATYLYDGQCVVTKPSQ